MSAGWNSVLVPARWRSSSSARSGLHARARAALALILASSVGLGLSAAAVATAPQPSAGSGWVYYRSPAGLTQAEVFTLHATRDPATGACENGGWSSGRVWAPGQTGERNVEVEIAFNPTLCEMKVVTGILGAP